MLQEASHSLNMVCFYSGPQTVGKRSILAVAMLDLCLDTREIALPTGLQERF